MIRYLGFGVSGLFVQNLKNDKSISQFLRLDVQINRCFHFVPTRESPENWLPWLWGLLITPCSITRKLNPLEYVVRCSVT